MKHEGFSRIDIHVHCNLNGKADLDQLAATCRANKTIICMIGGLRYGGHDYLPNEEVLAICKAYPDCFLPFAKLDLWETADPDEVYRYAEQGFRGLKGIYPYYEYDHDLYMPVYKAAEECGLPIVFHTGNFAVSSSDIEYQRPMLRNMHPITLDRIARSFQKLNIVMAHMGTRIFQDEASQYLKIHKNLYADLSGCGQWRRIQPQELVDMFCGDLFILPQDYNGLRNLVFGSDAYVDYDFVVPAALQSYYQMFDRIGLPQDVIQDIMGGTVASWLGIELDQAEHRPFSNSPLSR